jgi:signal transduction histidine kinase
MLLLSHKQKTFRLITILLIIACSIYMVFFLPLNPWLSSEKQAIAKLFFLTISFAIVLLQLNFWEKVHIKSRQVQIDHQAQLSSNNQLANLGIMTAGIAHEINNPLAIIAGYQYKIRKSFNNITEKTKEEAGDILKKQDDAILRIQEIVRNLLSLSRDGSADGMQDEQLITIIQESLALCKEMACRNGVDLIFDPGDNQFPVSCNKVQIGQVILNLINNSFDAVVGSERAWIKIEIIEDSESIVTKFIDSGSGIPDEIAQKVMSPFFTTKDVGKGTGLGLSLSSSIIHEHGGILELDSEAPNTCFVVRLPKRFRRKNI